MRSVLSITVIAMTGLATWSQRQVVDSTRTVNYELLNPVGLVKVSGQRPRDLVLSADSTKLWVRTMDGLQLLDSKTLAVLDSLSVKGGGTLTGLLRIDAGIWISCNDDRLRRYELKAGKIVETQVVELPKGSRPNGLCPIRPGVFAVCLTNLNTVGIVSIGSTPSVKQVPVGIAPYSVVYDAKREELWTSCLGGPRPVTGSKVAKSAGTEVEVDDHGVVAEGCVSVVDAAKGIWRVNLKVGLQPSGLCLDGSRSTLYVANSNEDSVSVIDVEKRFIKQTLNVKPDSSLMFGSMPGGVLLQSNKKHLFVPLSGNNLIAVFDAATLKPVGHIPTAWFPGAVAEQGGVIWIPNQKGIGSTVTRREKAKGKNSWDLTGAVQRVDLSPADWKKWGSRMAGLAKSLNSLNDSPRSNVKPVPIPARVGEPSTLKHVVYIIKENRTYDQVFGDIKSGDGDPKLCVFPEKITPNHHSIVKNFVLLDNYYCNGVCSADGHNWAIEGNVTPYLEKQFGSWSRAYDYGTDPITYSRSGFVWDWILGKGLSFRNFGELDFPEVPKGWNMAETWRNSTAQDKVVFDQRVEIDRLRKYTSRDFPGWNMEIPDSIRADRFLKEFGEWESKGVMPNFTIIYLPQDHTAGLNPGYPSPASYLADNDVALGRIVERISKSKFWKDTVVFANEDDPQAGFDHVDGNRSICLVASPYAKRGKTISQFYNQNSVLHTICRIFGIKAPNQKIGMAPLMSECFTAQPNLAGFTLHDPQVDRPKMNPELSMIIGEGKRLAKAIQSRGLKTPDFRDEKGDDVMNRSIWFAMKGNAPYPAKLAGAHGKGLRKKKLKHETSSPGS